MIGNHDFTLQDAIPVPHSTGLGLVGTKLVPDGRDRRFEGRVLQGVIGGWSALSRDFGAVILGRYLDVWFYAK